MATKAKNKRLIHQAALQAVVRYGPQLDALKQIEAESRGTFHQRVTAADSTAAAIHGAVDAAVPQLGSMYDEAGLRAAGIASTLTNHDLAALPDASAQVVALKAAGASEAAGAGLRLNAARTQALGDLVNRGVEAESGRGQAIRTAGDQFAGDLAKIGAQRSSLLGAKGAFAAATVGDLQEAEAARNFTASQNAANRKNSRVIATGHDVVSRANAQDRAKGKGGKGSRGTLPGGVKLATPGQHGTARDKIELGLTQVKALAAHGVKRADAATALVKGVGAYTKPSAKRGEPGKHVPGITAVPQLYASVALDLAYDGHVSHRNAELLHKRGLSVKKLGYSLPPRGASRTANQVGKTLATLFGG